MRRRSHHADWTHTMADASNSPATKGDPQTLPDRRGDMSELRASYEAVAVRIENVIERNMQMIAEALRADRATIERQLKEFEDRFGGRIKVLEESVSSLSQHVDVLSERVGALEVEVQTLRRDFDAERVWHSRDAASLHRLEARVDALERDVANLKSGRNDR